MGKLTFFMSLTFGSVLYGEQAKYFDDEIIPTVKHTKKGTVAMASAGKNMNGSQVCLFVSIFNNMKVLYYSCI